MYDGTLASGGGGRNSLLFFLFVWKGEVGKEEGDCRCVGDDKAVGARRRRRWSCVCRSRRHYASPPFGYAGQPRCSTAPFHTRVNTDTLRGECVGWGEWRRTHVSTQTRDSCIRVRRCESKKKEQLVEKAESTQDGKGMTAHARRKANKTQPSTSA